MASSSILFRKVAKPISISSKLICSFSTSDPPKSIPNRPLRKSSPSPPPPEPHLPKFNQPLRNDPSGADFLERFKLGFEKNPRGFKITKENNVEENVEDNANVNVVKESEEGGVLEDADDIFRKMKETGLIPNAVAMLDGLCKDGLIQEAMKLFGVMREKGTIPEVVIYTAVVEGFCKAEKFDDAVRIFRKMLGNGVEANAYSYGVLVRGLCKGKRLQDAVGFCVEMLEAGHPVNLATFVGLVDGVCGEKGLEDAKSFIFMLKQKGLFYDENGVKVYLEKNGPFSPLVWEAITGKKAKSSFFE